MAYTDPDIGAFRQFLAARVASRGAVTLEQQREFFDSDMAAVPLPPGCDSEALTLGAVPAERIVHPGATAGRVLLYLHGGGYVFGSLRSHRHLVARLAVAAGAEAFHLDYRLAPEHPYPAALDDALDAYRALLARGVDPARLVVGGESAGGGLATALLLKLRQAGLPQPAGLYLISPWLDMTTAGASYAKVGTRDPMIAADRIALVAQAYLGAAGDDAFTSPVRADPAGLPPMLIQVGSEEVLLSDSTSFAANAALAGIEVRLHVWAEMPHAFPLFHTALRAGLRAIEEAGAWMAARFAGG
jgi:acetyl esterase/lipase